MTRADDMWAEEARMMQTPPVQRHLAIHERMAVRALAPSCFGTATVWSEVAKDRLYRRMFPDEVCKG